VQQVSINSIHVAQHDAGNLLQDPSPNEILATANLGAPVRNTGCLATLPPQLRDGGRERMHLVVCHHMAHFQGIQYCTMSRPSRQRQVF